MYITTFYSFKGGVGRTFALVNVGAELARAGRTVLLVDFDLEAPGIDTFPALRPKAPSPGVVEYVTDYIATQSAPDVGQYIYRTGEIGDARGCMWIMPAGRGNDTYRRRLASINWQQLYRDLDGYLFFEDMKAQWRSTINPDYVLIDSRTGHTDVQGICTRQLPDAVAILFFPNDQNLGGLKQVVGDIRGEVARTRRNKQPITLHFIMSNVPDLDDEDGILNARLREFGRALGYDNFDRVHNYPSLSLLDQAIFTLERPKSRLARQYRRLKEHIVDENDEDPEGVVRFLEYLDSPHPHARRRRVADVERRLDTIKDKHSDNAEAMFLLGCLRKKQGDLQEALGLFNRAMGLGYRTSDVLVEMATCYSMMGDREYVSRVIQQLLELEDLKDYAVIQAVHLVDYRDRQLFAEIVNSNAFQSMDVEQRLLVAETISAKGAIDMSASVLHQLLNDPDAPARIQRDIRTGLALALIGLGNVEHAMKVLCPMDLSVEELEIQDVFNYAMAKWANSGSVPRDLFARVLRLDQATQHRGGPNYEQCLAVAYWAGDQIDTAEQRLAKAERYAEKIIKSEFSCWRYRHATREEFLDDCQKIRKLITAGEGVPAFFSCVASRKGLRPPQRGASRQEGKE